jgi:hypothetical protein
MKFPASCVSKLVAFILAACAPPLLADEPAKNAVIFGNVSLDEVSLIGLSKEEALKRLGEPDRIDGPEEGFQTYNYATRLQLDVVFREGKLVQYIVRVESKAKTAKGVTMGAHLAAVTAQYGDYSREEDMTEWFGDSEAKVLYHHPEFNKFKIIYPNADVFFMFDEQRNVEVIWVGFPTS